MSYTAIFTAPGRTGQRYVGYRTAPFCPAPPRPSQPKLPEKPHPGGKSGGKGQAPKPACVPVPYDPDNPRTTPRLFATDRKPSKVPGGGNSCPPVPGKDKPDVPAPCPPAPGKKPGGGNCPPPVSGHHGGGGQCPPVPCGKPHGWQEGGIYHPFRGWSFAARWHSQRVPHAYYRFGGGFSHFFRHPVPYGNHDPEGNGSTAGRRKHSTDPVLHYLKC